MSIPVMQEVGSTALKRASKDLRGNLTFMLAVAANCHPSEVVWYLAAVHLYYDDDDAWAACLIRNLKQTRRQEYQDKASLCGWPTYGDCTPLWIR